MAIQLLNWPKSPWKYHKSSSWQITSQAWQTILLWNAILWKKEML